MKAARITGPLPSWVRTLDEATFGDAWGEPAPHEAVWGMEPVAFARWSLVPGAGEAELLRIAVAPDHWGQGLAKALLGACEADLAREGIRDCHLEVRASNAGARGVYEAMGWAPSGTRARYYAGGEDAVLYAKRLV